MDEINRLIRLWKLEKVGRFFQPLKPAGILTFLAIKIDKLKIEGVLSLQIYCD